MLRVFIDFETRSAVDLKKAGLAVYASDATTDALCLAYAIGDSAPLLWRLGEPFPAALKTALAMPESIFIAHNAAFELGIWNQCCFPKYGWPGLPIKKVDCTMIRAYSMGLPGSLENAAKAVGLDIEKDMKGHRVMMQISKPRDWEYDTSKPVPFGEASPKVPVWWDDADKFKLVFDYCLKDVTVERELERRLLPLSEREREIWILDQKINARGVRVDIATARVAMAIASHEKARLDKEMAALTNNAVGSCNSSVALAQWLDYACGVKTEGVAKNIVLDLLALDTLPPLARKALLLRQEAAKASTAKIEAMLASANRHDFRVRGCFQYYGAPATGRWAGRRIQLQNLPRQNMKAEQILKILSILEGAA